MSKKRKIAFLALTVLANACLALLCYTKGKKDGYAEAKEGLDYDDCDCECCCNGGAKCCDIADNAVSGIEAEGDALQPNELNEAYGNAEAE